MSQTGDATWDWVWSMQNKNKNKKNKPTKVERLISVIWKLDFYQCKLKLLVVISCYRFHFSGLLRFLIICSKWGRVITIMRTKSRYTVSRLSIRKSVRENNKLCPSQLQLWTSAALLKIHYFPLSSSVEQRTKAEMWKGWKEVRNTALNVHRVLPSKRN